jgi:hypothetical protein
MKKILLPMLLLLPAFNAFAQKHDSIESRTIKPFNLLRETQEYKGFVITLRAEIDKIYGFDISLDHKAMGNGFPNPLPFSRGIRKKEDAYKIAQWIINEHEKTGHWQHTMPPHVARELKIECN